MQDLERVRYITRFFGMLQGLKAIPFGLLLMALATQDIGWGFLGEQGNCTYTLPLFLFMLVLLFAIDQYYVKTFGRVKPLNRRTQIQETTLFLSAFALIVVLENWLTPPFSLMGLGVATVFIITAVTSKRWYYIPLGGLVVIASFVPLVMGVPINDRIYGSLGAVLKIVIGVAIIGAGIIDHFMLMRYLKAHPGEQHGRAK